MRTWPGNRAFGHDAAGQHRAIWGVIVLGLLLILSGKFCEFRHHDLGQRRFLFAGGFGFLSGSDALNNVLVFKHSLADW